MRVAVVFESLRPEHWARLAAAARYGHERSLGEVLAIGVVPNPAGYVADTPASRLLRWRVALSDHSPSALCRRAAPVALIELLEEACPDTLAVAGWSEPWALAAMQYAVSRRIPIVMMGNSSGGGTRWRWLKDHAKRALIKPCGASLVAGSRQRAYMVTLGMDPGAVFDGYNAVDNAHFAAGKSLSSRDEGTVRTALGLPQHFFLACNRLVPEKNLGTLVDAFALYRAQCTELPWKLVIVGEGPCRGELLARIESLDLIDDVVLAGHVDYEELPVVYHCADALVLASVSETWGLVVNEAMASGLPVLVSTHCGCVDDLLHDEFNGWRFDPRDVRGLAALLCRIAADASARAELGRAGRSIIADWGPERFAAGLWNAVHVARHKAPRAASAASRLALFALRRWGAFRPRRYRDSVPADRW
jgi:glycosyltransferase involved in cell wall biosynthesis